MRYTICLLIFASFFMGCKEEKPQREIMKLEYPETKKVDTVDTYFGVEIADPYRWLEDDMSEETKAWVTAQNQLTFGFLDSIPYRDQINKKLSEMWNYERLGSPFKEGNYTYYYKNDGLQDHSVLYREKDGKEEVFLDPNTFSEDKTTSLSGISFSKDGSLLAYSISEGGSDWRKVIIIDAETKTQIGDTLRDLKFTGMSWKGNEGIYYSTYDKPDGSQLSSMTDQHRLYFHKLNTPQSNDPVVFGNKPEEVARYIGGYVSDDGRYLFISRSVSTSGNELYYIDLQGANTPVPIITGFDTDTYILDNVGSTFYLVTNADAPNQKIVTVDAANPDPANWKDLIPETENVLNPTIGGGYIFARYMVDAVSKVYQYDYQGQRIREIALPGVGSAGGFGGKKEDTELYFSFSNYNTPGSIYKLNAQDGSSELYWKPNIQFNPDNYESKQVFYTSKDGTQIPMIITHKKGLKLDGTNPTLLYGYGGFNISLTPSFSPINAVWLELGGIYAVPNLRGGGEYGKKWHDAGTKFQKQNVFDDFIAAAEYLIDNKYTSSDYLAVRGGSNGGLLVGAVVNQRPELFKVGIPQVGVMDMLRYHVFTAGAGWAYDYGRSDDSLEMFEYLKGYSPLHNIQAGKNYPAIMVTTADHDDRVVPAHSFKYAAQLQATETGDQPKLIRIDVGAGHGAGMSTEMTIKLHTDIMAFILYNMGIDSL